MARLLLAALLLATPVLAQGTPSPRRVAVVPFAALSGDVPLRSGVKAAAMFATELRNASGAGASGAAGAGESAAVEVLGGGGGGEGADGAPEALARARAAVAEARTAREGRRMRPAEEALQRALADFGAAAAAVEDVGEVADAWALLAAVQYGAGQDERAAESLARALALAPGRALPLAATSPLFAREVERVRQAVLSGPPGRLVVESTPAGAAVVVDGVPYGAAPVLVRDVPTGTHLWRVQLPSGEWVGGAVEVAAGREVRVVGAPVGGTPASRLVALLARNRVDAELVRAAREHAQAERADAVFLGAVRREGRQLALEVFLLEATSGELRRLPRATFDEDLLSASQQFLRLAGEYVRAGTLGEPVRLPVAVTAATLPAPARAERRFARGPAPDAPGSRTRPAGLDTEERAGEPRQEPGTRAPLRRPPPKKD